MAVPRRGRQRAFAEREPPQHIRDDRQGQPLRRLHVEGEHRLRQAGGLPRQAVHAAQAEEDRHRARQRQHTPQQNHQGDAACLGEKGPFPVLPPSVLAAAQHRGDALAHAQGQMDPTAELRIRRLALLRRQQHFGCRRNLSLHQALSF